MKQYNFLSCHLSHSLRCCCFFCSLPFSLAQSLYICLFVCYFDLVFYLSIQHNCWWWWRCMCAHPFTWWTESLALSTLCTETFDSIRYTFLFLYFYSCFYFSRYTILLLLWIASFNHISLHLFFEKCFFFQIMTKKKIINTILYGINYLAAMHETY